MNEKIKLDIISDVVCPWCIVGYKRLQKAISELGIEDKLEIEWQPFELNPSMPIEGQNMGEHLSQKYGSSVQDNNQNKERLKTLGAEEGFTFNFFDDMKMVNTRDSHVLIEYAKEQNKQTELNIRLIEAFYTEKKDISNREVLKQELLTVGLNSIEALERLDKSKYKEEVEAKEQLWQNMGVSGVPTIVFNRKSALTGAQPTEVYKQVLTELLNE